MRVNRFDAGRQPAGRAPAPGRLGLVQAFLNSFWDLDRHGAEGWPDPGAYGTWLGERGVGAGWGFSGGGRGFSGGGRGSCRGGRGFFGGGRGRSGGGRLGSRR